MIRVSHYGVHWIDGIAFLEQASGSSSVTGLEELDSPFMVRPMKRGSVCPHAINLDDASLTPEEEEQFSSFKDDPIVRALSPVPKPESDRFFFFPDPEGKLLPYALVLARMSSPTQPLVVPIWTQSFDVHLSNVAPIVITEAAPSKTKLINHITSTARLGVRTVVIIGDPAVVLSRDFKPHSTRITETKIEDLRELPWERIGSYLLRKFMKSPS